MIKPLTKEEIIEKHWHNGESVYVVWDSGRFDPEENGPDDLDIEGDYCRIFLRKGCTPKDVLEYMLSNTVNGYYRQL